MHNALIAGLLVLLPFVFNSQDFGKHGVLDQDLPLGLNVGDTVMDLELTFQDGTRESLYDYSKDRPTVVLFYRGEWCPVCNKYLSNLTDSLAMIKEKANVIVVSPETKGNMLKMQEEHPEYNYILDGNQVVMSTFDVLFYVTKKYQKKIKTFLRTDITKQNGQEVAKLPVPATYIVGKNGVILFEHFNYDYGVRATATEILSNL